MTQRPLRFADLFAGIGGFHAALVGSSRLRGTCVFASDIDRKARAVYSDSYGFEPTGNIWPIAHDAGQVPDHDILCAGFPCQPFSKSGHQRGIEEARGTLFEAILLILKAKRPAYVLLENVPNLLGPKHQKTWVGIVRMLRDCGYAVSSKPTMLSPHNLPHEFGAPQVRKRVFIPGVYVGREAARELSPELPFLLPEQPFPGWQTDQWKVIPFLSEQSWAPDDPSLYAVKPDKARAIDMWNDFISRLDGRIPRFPIWTDVFLGTLTAEDKHPRWKNGLIKKSADFYEQNRNWIDQWATEWRLAEVTPSYRKLEWQAQDGERDIWRHAIQFRPSGIRVRPLTYLPALVAMNQTPIIGPERRTITPHEAGLLQGFRRDACGPHIFKQHSDPNVAFKQFGNAVNVGTTRLVAESLVLGIEGKGPVPVDEAWREVGLRFKSRPRTPADIAADDQLQFEDDPEADGLSLD